MCLVSTDFLALHRESEGLACIRKSRSFADFSQLDHDDDIERRGGCFSERKSSKRRAGSTDSLRCLETVAEGHPTYVRVAPVACDTLAAVPSLRVSPPHVPLLGQQPLPSLGLASPEGAAVEPRDCDGCCETCTSAELDPMRLLENRFLLARATTSPPAVLCDTCDACEACEACEEDHAASDPARTLGRSVSEGRGASPPGAACCGLPPLPPGAEPCAPPRPCSLFLSSSLPLVQPPSLITPCPTPGDSASPLSSMSCASPFGACASSSQSSCGGGSGPAGAASAAPGTSAAAQQHLKHSRSEETICSQEALQSTPSGELGLGGSAHGRLSMSVELPPRASMDSFVATSSHLNEGSAAQELFYRLNHARQTLDFVKRQASVFSSLNHAELDVWEALELLGTLREYEMALLGDDNCDTSMLLNDHALQTAEACRLAFPEHDWLHLVGLIHDLGKLLAHKQWGGEPQWAVCGETFPVGCRFHPSIMHSQFFSANPDRRRRAYSTATGIYQLGCGLNSVYMSWSAAEYLYMVLLKNKTLLPPEALFLIRYHRCCVLLRPGAPYSELLSEFDRRCLPWVKRFRELARYTRRELPGRLEGAELKAYYDGLLAKYLPQSKLRW